MSKVSVIVPVYKVENYIEKCVRSLFEQTMEDIEVLFVDDSSPDNSVEIIERLIEEYQTYLAKKKYVVRVIRMPSNSGQAVARRRGILEATGDYVIHCDSDDWVDIDLYEKMYKEAIISKSDIVICGYIYEYLGHADKREALNVADKGKDVVRNWYRKCIFMSCCNKLVRRTLYIENTILPWEGLNMWEDNGLMTRLFYYADRISVMRDSYYHYNRTNLGAVTNGYDQKSVRQMIGIAEYLTEFFESKSDAEDFRKTVMAFQFLAKINLITDSFSRIKEYHTLFPESNAIISELDPRAFSARGRLRFYMVKYHLAWLFVLMFKVRNWINSKSTKAN